VDPRATDHKFGGRAHFREVGQNLSRRRVDVEADVGRRLPSGHHRGHDRESRKPGLALDPITACVMSSPATSRTGTTLPGDDGLAIKGSICERSIDSSTS